jgi:predicted dehydrogenase
MNEMTDVELVRVNPGAGQQPSTILIAGLGSVGRRHLHNLQALGHQDVILYRTKRSTLPENDLADLLTENDLGVALAKRPQAAIIANPTALHIPVAIAAAQAGCHLFIEKPVSDSINGLDRLAAIVQEQRLRVLVGFQFRFHPGLQTIKKFIDNGVIGDIVCAHSHWGEYLPAWHPWEDYHQSYSARADLGGGVILTMCHPFDYLRWLLGEVRTVSAVAGRLSGLKLDVEDTADITLQFESGVIGSVHLDYVQRPPSHWLRITGLAGTIEWDNGDGVVRWYRADRKKWETLSPPPDFERNRMFLDEMRHFLDCIAGQSDSVVTLEDGVRALRIALAAKYSAIEGRMMEVNNG